MEQNVPLTAVDKDDFERLWDNAFAGYEKETGRKLQNNKELRDLRTIDDLINKIEAKGGSFTGWRNKHSKLWTRLSTCFKPIVNIGGVAKDVLSFTPFPAASPVLGAALYLVKASDRVTDAYDWIETVFGELQEFTDRLNLYLKSKLDTVLEKKVTAILAFLLKIIGRSEKLVSRGSFRHYLRVVFLGNDDKTKKIVDELNQSLKNEQSYVIAATYADGKAVLRKFGAIEQANSRNTDALNDIHGALEGSANREITKEDDQLIQYNLESPAVGRTFELNAELSKRLLSGSGAWLEKETLFTAWSEQRIPILWIFGGPGSGKSHLSRWAINYLETLYVQDQGNPSGVAVAFFYVKENEAQLRDANTILKTLAWQIAHVDPVFKKHAVEVCKFKKKIITPEETWSNLFLAFYKPIRTVDHSAILVIDGLDEASKFVRATILGLCKDLLVQDSSGVRLRVQVAIIGRITLKGDMEFEREEKFIEVSPEKNKDDIDKYIEKRLSELELLKKLEKLDKAQIRKPTKQQSKPIAPSVRRKLKDKILTSADGIFLWAQLLLDQIQKKEAHEIEKILNSPPQSLEDMVRHVFERLAAEEDDLNTIKQLLSWMAYARRPLCFGEIDLILSLPSGSPNLLLWDAFRGKFASIFHLVFPEGYIEDVNEIGPSPDASIGESGRQADESSLVSGDNRSEGDQQSNEGEDREEIEGSDADEGSYIDGNESDTDEKDETFKLFNVDADRGLEALASGVFNEELATIHAYSDFQLRTVIMFSHQQFRDFLVPQQDRAPMALDIDNRRSQIEITITCLDILRLGHAERRESRYLADYPSRNFFHHLQSIDSAIIEAEDRRKILDGLYWFFHELAGTRALVFAPPDSDSPAWNEYWMTWVAADKYTKTVRGWFEQIDQVCDSFDEQAVAWMRAAALSAKQLFKPWIANLARIWLEKTGFDDEAYLNKSEMGVWLMHGILCLDDEGIISKDLKEFTFYQLDFRQLSVERIQDLASYAPIKDTPHWHTGLAWILMEGEYNEPSISHFKKALTMEPNAWLPKEGLARIYGSQGIYPEAIRLMQEAYESLPSNLKYLGGFLLPRIAAWKREVGDRDGAYEAARQGYIAEPSSPLAQNHFLRALDDEGYSDITIELLKCLVDNLWIETSRSWFTELLMQQYPVFVYMGRAFRAEGKPAFIIDEMDKTINIVSNSQDDYLKIHLYGRVAFFKYEYNDQVEPSIKLLEQALKLISTGNILTNELKNWTKKWYGNALAQLYFDSAVAARKIGMNAWPFTSKLKKVATVTNTTTKDTEDAFDFYGTGYESMLWGCWLRDYEAAKAPVWQKCFRARVLEELELLDDNDPTNDMKGLHTLAITLLHVNDSVNAAAILAILFKPVESIRAAYAKVKDGEDEGLDDIEDERTNSNAETHKNAVQAAEQDSGSSDDGKCQEKTKDYGDEAEERIAAAKPIKPGRSLVVPNEEDLQELGDRWSPLESGRLAPSTEASGEPTSVNANRTMESQILTFDPLDDPEQGDLVPNDEPFTTADGRLTLSLSSSWIHECDGPCDTSFWNYEELYVCKICFGKKFCGECIKLVKAGTLVRRDCCPDHDWYQAWPISEPKWKEIAEEVDGHLVMRPEWLQKIRAEWL